MSSAHIEEVAEAHIIEVAGSAENGSDDATDDESHDIFKVFATERRKRDAKMAKLQELLTPPARAPTPKPPEPVSTTTKRAGSNRPNPQYRYQAAASVEDQQLTDQLREWLMDGKLSLTTPAHVFAASPSFRKDLVDRLRTYRIDTNSSRGAPDGSSVQVNSILASPRTPEYSLPLLEVDVIVAGQVIETGVLDNGSQIVAIRKDLACEVQAAIDKDLLLEMEVASCGLSWTLGVC